MNDTHFICNNDCAIVIFNNIINFMLILIYLRKLDKETSISINTVLQCRPYKSFRYIHESQSTVRWIDKTRSHKHSSTMLQKVRKIYKTEFLIICFKKCVCSFTVPLNNQLYGVSLPRVGFIYKYRCISIKASKLKGEI